MILRVIYWSASIIALASYALLMVIFAVSKKDRNIRSFMLVLACMIGWTGCSLLMKTDAVPGFAFWSLMLSSLMIVLPPVTYHFVANLLGYQQGKLRRFLWFFGTVLMVALNFAGVFVRDRVLNDPGYGMISVGYVINWPIVFVVAFTLAAVAATFAVLKKAVASGKTNLKTIRPMIVGLILMFLGFATKLTPFFSQYPIDVVTSLINAALFIRVIYSTRVFTLKFVMTRGLIFAVIAFALTIGLGFAGVYLDDVLSAIIPEDGSFEILRVIAFAVLFGIAFQVVYLLSKAVVDRFYVNSEYTRRQALRNFSVNISNNLDLDKILSELASAVKEGVQATGVYVLLRDLEKECYYTAHSGNVLENPDISISVNNPIVSWLLENNRCLPNRQISILPYFRSMWTSERALLKEYDINIFVPLICRDSLIGMLLLAAPERFSEYTVEDMDVLQSLGTSTAIAIDNARMYESAKLQARTDELTGLLNRRSFYEDLEKEVGRARNEGTSLGLILIDVDMFKLYNDMHGSYEGDLALRRIGRMVQNIVGPEGVSYRYSGQEFTVFLPGTDGHRAKTVAECIRRCIEEDFMFHEDQTKRFLTVSGGVSIFPHTAHSADELMRRADFAKVAAKNAGKNRIHVYTPGGTDDYKKRDEEMPFATTVYALAAAIDAKDHFTFSHSQKVADYVVVLALEAGMDSNQLPMLREAALLHDIGKIGVPESILIKPGKLDVDEYGTIKQHVVMSIEIIKHLPSLNYVIPTVLGHHERWDGKGYPRGIAGEEIPFGARCLAVVDTFDAMVSERPYKPACTVEYALQEIERQAGHQFDPELAVVFVRLVREGKIVVQK